MSSSSAQPLSNGAKARRKPSRRGGASKSQTTQDEATKPELPESEQWEKLRSALLKRMDSHSSKDIFGDCAAGGAVYRWGVATSRGEACDPLTVVLSRLAANPSAKTTPLSEAELQGEADSLCDSIVSGRPSVPDCCTAVLWAAALPALSKHLDVNTWWSLLGALQQARELTLQRDEANSPAHLILAAELGLTLAWRLADLPSCKRLQKSSANELAAWFEGEEDSISEAVSRCTSVRLVMASVIRCRKILENTTKRKFKKRQIEIASDLATWVAGMTIHTGGSAFSAALRRDLKDDLQVHGLLRETTRFDPETLGPAMSAALGESQSGGRLAWQVCLPESMLSCEEAKVAVLLPEWDVRRGRIHVDFSQEDLRLEVFAGKPCLISGHWQAVIEVDGERQHPCGDWSQACEYTDDDVHYLELEQPWSGDVALQRQFLVLRDDRCVLLSDAVICRGEQPSQSGAARENGKPGSPRRSIRYTGRLPLSESLDVQPEPDTRELFIADRKCRALAIPLAASEWRVGPTPATLEASEDGHLVHQVQGVERLYAPIWLDLQTRRFKRPRTWRQLTIADELRIVGQDEAVGYRVQVGSEQWMAYRALGAPRCRTVLGQHMLADFLCTRFDMGDGSHEELLTVDAQTSDD